MASVTIRRARCSPSLRAALPVKALRNAVQRTGALLELAEFPVLAAFPLGQPGLSPLKVSAKLPGFLLDGPQFPFGLVARVSRLVSRRTCLTHDHSRIGLRTRANLIGFLNRFIRSPLRFRNVRQTGLPLLHSADTLALRAVSYTHLKLPTNRE